MPIVRELTKEELDTLMEQGIDPAEYIGKKVTLLTDEEVSQQQPEATPEKMGVGEAIGKSLRQKAGGIAGAGLGAIAAPALVGTMVGGPLGLAGGIITGVAGAMGGGYAGQKGQEAIEGPERAKQFEEEAAQAAEQHPIAVPIADISASMLAAGAMPKPSNIPMAARALRSIASRKAILSAADEAAMAQMGREGLSAEGAAALKTAAAEKEALAHVAMNAGVMPAINTGIELATTGQLPSAKQLALDVAGGAVFSGQSKLGKLFSPKGETMPEPAQKIDNSREAWQKADVKLTDIPELTPDPKQTTAYTEMLEDGKTPKIDDAIIKSAFAKVNPKPDLEGMSETDAYTALSEWKRKNKIPVSEMRNQLHEAELKRQTALQRIKLVTETPKPETKPEPAQTAKIAPEVATPPAKEPPKEAVSWDDIRRREVWEKELSERESYLKYEAEQNARKQRAEDFNKAKEDLQLQDLKENLRPKLDQPETLKLKEGTTLPVADEAGLDKAMLDRQRAEQQAKDHAERIKLIEENKAITEENRRKAIADEYDSQKKFLADEAKRVQEEQLREEAQNKLSEVDEKVNQPVGIGKIVPPGRNSRLADYWIEHYGKGNVDAAIADAQHALEINQSTGNEPVVRQYRELLAALNEKKGVLAGPDLNGPKAPIERNTGKLLDSNKNPGTVRGNLELIASDKDSDFSELAAHLLKVGDRDGLNVKVHTGNAFTNDHTGHEAMYIPGPDHIIMHTSRYDEATTLHEIIHAFTSKKLPNVLQLHGREYKAALDDYIKNGPDENVKELIRAYYDTMSYMGKYADMFEKAPGKLGRDGIANLADYQRVHGYAYGLRNLHEFVAEALTDNAFQTFLNKIPNMANDGTSLWTKFVDAIKKIFKMNVKQGSLLERVLKHSEEVIKVGRQGPIHDQYNALHDAYINEKGMFPTFVSDDSISYLDKKGNTVHDNNPSAEDLARAKEYERVGQKAGNELPWGGYQTEHGVYYGPPVSKDGVPEGIKKQGYSFLPFLTSRIDKIATHYNNPTGRYVAQQLHKFHGEMDFLVGKIANRMINVMKGYDSTTVDKVYHYLHDIDNTGSSTIQLTPKEKEFAEKVKAPLREMREEQIKSGPKIQLESGALRTAKVKQEGYMFNILSSDVASEWAERPNSELSKKYNQLYIDHLVSKDVSREEATALLDEYQKALGNRSWRDVEFKAIRRAEGAGLPWELVDQNFASASLRYGERAARDLSYFKHIQSDPKMRKALSIADESGARMKGNELPDVEYIGSSDVVDKAMRSVVGMAMPVNKQLMGWARAAGNTVMGVGTAARNIVTMPAIAATYVQTGQMHLLGKAIAHMNDSRARAFESNAVRANFADFDAAGYVKNDPNPVINLLNKYSSFMRKYQGRDFSDKFEGEFYYSLGELLATDNIAKAQKGNIESRRFLQRFGDIVDGGPERLFKGEVKPEDVQRIAKRFVDASRGTYSAEGLPSFALEGELAPFAALSKFSIEKSNTVIKDVINPMREGNYGPLIRYSLASLGVGALIEGMNELLSNKRGPDPTIAEIQSQGGAMDYAAKIIGLGQLASFAGIVSDGAKAATQMYQGKELRYNQPLSFPLYTLVTDTLMGNVKDAVAAIQDGQDPANVMAMLATTIAGQSVQTMRYVDSNFIHPEETKRKEKFRDVSVYEQLNGQTGKASMKSNPFDDADAKKFKRTGDVNEAMKLLPGLIQEAIEKSKGDPFDLKRRLTSLKQNSYQTMPSMETMPLSFARYIQHLKATQGEEAANARLLDFVTQNAINKAKSSAIP